MAPYGQPNYNFPEDEFGIPEEHEIDKEETGVAQVTMWYLMVLMSMLIIWIMIFFCLRVFTLRQKTRSSQQRRTFIAPRQRPSLSQAEPTIYVSPANLPPPPKYEAMAPPSYEEVVGIHYPNYQPPVQPITQPITAALAQSSNSPDNVTNIESQSNAAGTVPSNVTPCTVITVTNERTAVTASS
ncbi:uncharacterized protein LOC123865481 isoform X2 [Maniola jurtina]|uniref:uncharacterized protein LOC123865481 isoform X2 n=1 Tax=Maniola jurtina TaxID=191418 RepID=UPI001E68EA4A|nr:uncharacterized protein LOC123865481 isoform X2 [Maniola jurtina]